MRCLVAACFLASGLFVLGADNPKDKPLTPAEAIKRVNEKVTVQMFVKATKNRLEKRKEIYLDSEEDFRDARNLGIIITLACAEKYKEAGVADPAEYFKDKTIRVTGTVIIKDERPRIEIDDPKQIVLVNK